jgi:hypothetical protein
MREVRYRKAREYVLSHPDESKRQQAKGAEVSEPTIARIRAELIKEGLFAPSRKDTQPRGNRVTPPPLVFKDEPTIVEARRMAPPRPTRYTPEGLLDAEAMATIADLAEQMEEADDETVHKKLLRQCLTFAFDPKLHPDTRMSASQMWAKLRDLLKAKDLGPGKPVDFEAGTLRLADLMSACGPQMTLAAVKIAFDTKEAPGGQPTLAPGGATEAPGETGHAGDPETAEDLRPIDLGVRREDEPEEGLEHQDPAGPEA